MNKIITLFHYPNIHTSLARSNRGFPDDYLSRSFTLFYYMILEFDSWSVFFE